MSKKYKLLIQGIVLDAIGMVSFMPIVGEFLDIIWAPISAYLILRMYKGKEGKVASIVSFVEEAGFFGTDFIPTFTLTWAYKFLIRKDKG